MSDAPPDSRTAWAWVAGTFFGAGLLKPGPGTWGSAAAALIWLAAGAGLRLAPGSLSWVTGALAALAFRAGTACAPYAALFDEAAWRACAELFCRDLYRLHSMPPLSQLTVHLQVPPWRTPLAAPAVLQHVLLLPQTRLHLSGACHITENAAAEASMGMVGVDRSTA